MKKLNLLLMAIFFPILLSAQENTADKLFDKYAGKDGFTTISFNSGMIKMLADVDDTKGEPGSFLKQIKEVRILSGDDNQQDLNFYKEILKSFPEDEYEELMTIKDADTDVKIWIKENSGIIRELVLVASGTEDNTLIIVRGNIEMDKLSGLGKSLNVDGLSVLSDLK
jgi:hypothetical protein